MATNAQIEEICIHLTDGLQILVHQVNSMKNDMLQIKKDIKKIAEAVNAETRH